MNIIKCKNYEEVTSVAAKMVVEQVRAKPTSVLGLATGATPLGLYESLIKFYNQNEIDFNKVTTFNLDEYYPIKKDNTQSYHYFMYENLFNRINIKKENIHILDGETLDVENECMNFEKTIKKNGGIDLQILGIGQNGHIGFNEPNESLESTTHITSLTQSTIEANSRFFENASEVPTQALTMGIATIMKARKIIIIACGNEKAEVVKSLISGKIITQNPSTLLNAHNDVTLIVDEMAINPDNI